MAAAGVGQQDVIGDLDVLHTVCTERLRRRRRRLHGATPHNSQGQEVGVHLGHVGKPGLSGDLVLIILLEIQVARQASTLLAMGALSGPSTNP